MLTIHDLRCMVSELIRGTAGDSIAHRPAELYGDEPFLEREIQTTLSAALARVNEWPAGLPREIWPHIHTRLVFAMHLLQAMEKENPRRTFPDDGFANLVRLAVVELWPTQGRHWLRRQGGSEDEG